MIANKFFGSDPEFFISGLSGLIPPAFFRIKEKVPYTFNPNDIDSKHPIFITEDGITVHEDGAALELTIPPSKDSSEIFSSIQYGFELAKKVFGNFEEFNSIVAVPAIRYNFDRWNSMGDEMIFANRAGCDPDEDVFNLNRNEEIDMTVHPYRYAGGHIHMSSNDEKFIDVMNDLEKTNNLVKLCAISLGVTNLAFSRYPKQEKLRQFRFGKPGKFRRQEYPNGYVGLEYRTVSTAWTNDSDLCRRLYSLAAASMDIVTDEKRTAHLLLYTNMAKDAILSGDVELCKEFYREIVEKFF